MHLNNSHRLVDGLLFAGAGVDPVNKASDASATGEDRKNDNQYDQHSIAATRRDRLLSAWVGTALGSYSVYNSE